MWGETHSRHGFARRKENGGKADVYNIWHLMRARCQSPRAAHYQDYGGRGITVCERWDADFAAFYADVGPRPSRNHSIDRINNDGNYEPGNVRWATASEQARNRRRRSPGWLLEIIRDHSSTPSAVVTRADGPILAETALDAASLPVTGDIGSGYRPVWGQGAVS